MRGLFALSLLPLLATSSPLITETIHNDAAPVLSSSTSQEIPDSYIVVFKKDVAHSSAADHHEWVQEQHHECAKAKRELHKRSQTPLTTFGGLKHTYNIAGGLLGYSGHFDEDVIEKVRRHPDVSKTRCPLALSCSSHVIDISSKSSDKTVATCDTLTFTSTRWPILKGTRRYTLWIVGSWRRMPPGV